MKSDYLIVHKKVLPDYFEKVVEAREMLRRGTIREVSEAARTFHAAHITNTRTMCLCHRRGTPAKRRSSR